MIAQVKTLNAVSASIYIKQQCGFIAAVIEQVAMEAEPRVMGGEKVFKEKMEHENLPRAKTERHSGAWGARQVVRK